MKGCVCVDRVASLIFVIFMSAQVTFFAAEYNSNAFLQFKINRHNLHVDPGFSGESFGDYSKINL
jgi:hypothetical protein